MDAGTQVTYTILVTNTGPATATDVRVLDTMPSQLSFVSATASNGGVCNAGVLCVLGSVAVNEVVTVTIVANIDAGVRLGTRDQQQGHGLLRAA